MKIKASFLLLALALVLGCQQPEPTGASRIKKGMIKVAILYPNGEGKTFDMDYYSTKHMPLAASLFGDALVTMSIDKGLSSGVPDVPVPYLAMGYFYFENMEVMQKVMGPNRDQLRADIPNYTNIQPVIQVSEVVQR
jgi:uncharacterized protein (TIGR02118 family)